MALREVRHVPDSVLRKVAKPVTEMTPRLKTLIKDMYNTMDYEDGIGLAAPQVGILKRIFTVGIGDIRLAFVNPEVLESEGEYLDVEGCLSIPGENGVVKRPTYVKVKAMNEEGKHFIIEAKYLLARCILHELDHLNGVLFTDKLEEVEEDFEPEEQVEDLLISLTYSDGE
ncbi:peptide deformylase [Proteiniclasticum ruminis]|jgi:peptide deformylase|uniref:Peptide deformylase n=1 Tax=Proteiniclasticum ruminis TaxID=398199 RepID=A0A1G8G6V9_9CLOT|nr:peptide deformylase [Proteiniclasticum ruminis]MBP9920572.1 peptide deformylase [Proteiniclasticum sp.]SDH90113.1 peptide deformylase [Proteiniclasticum ruminis]